MLEVRKLCVAAAIWVGLTAGWARAVILYGSPDRNLSAPTGNLTDSGWQYEGQWNGFLGTAIGPNTFITAAHVGGQVGVTPFVYNGQSYTTTASYDSNYTLGLRVWRVD